jgi:predicted nicotinamide N-methyase
MDAASFAWVQQFIQANLPIHSVPSVPEILLHRAGPRSGLWRLAERDADFGTPYWAYDWGGGLALARHVLDHPDMVIGRRVLDLGAGSGIVGIAAAKAGATEVIAADTDPYAIAAIGLNAAANRVTVLPVLGDLTGGSPPAVDVILVGDLFYDDDLAERVTSFLEQCFNSNVKVLIGDPWRAFLPRSRLQLLAEYPGRDFGDINRVAQQKNAVFSFEPACRHTRQ